jgi:ABC-type multidrug transport system ATPase subunit
MVSTLATAADVRRRSQNAVEARGLTKEYGRVPALCPLDLCLPRGDALALVGPTDAGKSTVLGILAGLVHPTWGELRILGLDPSRHAAALRRRIGVLRQEPHFFFWMTGRETLRLAGRMLARGDADLDRGIDALIEECGLAGAADERTGDYSAAQRRRLGLAQALVGGPELLLLDEPFTGLDTGMRAEMIAIVKRNQRGRTIVLSARALDELPDFVDTALVLNRGRQTFAGPVRGCTTVGEALYRR